MNKKIIAVIIAISIITIIITIMIENSKTKKIVAKGNIILKNEKTKLSTECIDNKDILNNKEIIISDLDGNKTNYSFTYEGINYTAIYSKDNWKIIDSYKIDNSEDITKICQALIDIHPIHGKDMISYRTADDMAYEWIQHNIAYQILPKGNQWRKNAKDVDLDPQDQGKNLAEIYESRTGKKIYIQNK